jgi:probable selenate reductase FAD-binding subunit
MITAYHRPTSLEEALALLARAAPQTRPLGGGTLLAHGQIDSIEVVDLQALGLNRIRVHGRDLEIGATATLQQLLEDNDCPAALKVGLKLEAPLNIRNIATVAGTLVACDGRSSFVTALLACDAKLTILNPKSQAVSLGDYLPLRSRGLITAITIPTQVALAMEYVSRTPADKPIVCVAVAQWPSGRTRLAVGGYGQAPRLAMEGAEAEGLEAAARNALHEATDPWGSAEYRMDVAETLSKRCLAAIGA